MIIGDLWQPWGGIISSVLSIHLTVARIGLVGQLGYLFGRIAQFAEPDVVLVGVTVCAVQGFGLCYVVGQDKIPGQACRFPRTGIFLFHLFESLSQSLIYASRLEQDSQILEEKLLRLGIPGGYGGQRLEGSDFALRIIY